MTVPGDPMRTDAEKDDVSRLGRMMYEAARDRGESTPFLWNPWEVTPYRQRWLDMAVDLLAAGVVLPPLPPDPAEQAAREAREDRVTLERWRAHPCSVVYVGDIMAMFDRIIARAKAGYDVLPDRGE